MRQFWRNFRAPKIPITVNRRRGSFFFIVLSSLKGYLSISFCYSFVWLAIHTASHGKRKLNLSSMAICLDAKKTFHIIMGEGKNYCKVFFSGKTSVLGRAFCRQSQQSVCPCAVVFQHRAKIILSSLYFRGLMPLPPLVIYNVKPKFVCVVPPLLLLVLRCCSTD